MGIEEEVLQVTYRVEGLEQGRALETQLDRLRDARGRFVARGGEEAAAEARVAASAEAATVAYGNELNAIYAAENAMESFTAEASAAASAQGRLGGATTATRGGIGGLQQSIIAGSYAFQDFTATSGDLGAKLNSVSNNLPGLLVGLGGLGTVLSIGATAAIAVYRNWDSIASLWETRNPFPKAAGDIEGLKRELDRAKDGLEKFEKAGTGTAESIAKYNELRATTARLETEIAEQQERQQRIKRAVEAPSEEQAGRGKGFEEAIQGRGGEYLAQIREALEKQGQAEIEAADVQRKLREQAFAQEGHTPEEQKAFAKEQTDIFRSVERGVRATDFDAESRKLFDGLLQGQGRAGVLLRRLMDETGLVWDGLRERMEAMNPQVKKKAEGAGKAAGKAMEDVRKFLDDEFDRDLKELKDASRADKAAGKGDAKGDAKDAKDAKARDAVALRDAQAAEQLKEDEVKGQLKKVDASVGDPYRQRYEAALAGNAASLARGGPGLDPAELERRLRLEMFQMLRKRGASPEVAQRASAAIADAGNADLARRMGQLANEQGTNQAKLITLAAGLNGEMARAVQVQVRHGAAINALMQGQQARQRSGRNRGRGG